MTELFKDSTRKNFDGLETWDTSNVTTMERMFHRAKYFNHPIGNWDVSSVTNMECIFCGCSNFNQPLDRWDVSNAKDMAYMFCKATSFRQPITAWRLCGQSTKGMFLRLPDYRDMESRVMCLTPHDEEAMRYDLEDMIGIFGEEAVQDALRLYGPKYGLKED
ncbi:BspA family leucine-rich repeat surface protein [Phocaeicola barnesiae]|uniref:BspA family leucine-rich repeat surface protein n=1 Tax=Phocaeicola barnesiae TaxID=376804 RepID=UPI001F214DD7